MIGMKHIYLQENFLKENLLIQLRFLIDKRNLKFDMTQENFMFAS